MFQTSPKIVFLLLVESGATRLVDQAQQVPGLRVAQGIPHAGIELGRLAIALPDVVPFVLSLKERCSRGVDAIFVRIERELTPADVAEGFPPVIVGSTLERFRVAHPRQRVSDRIADREELEVLSFETLSLKTGDRLLCQQGERPQHGFTGLGIPCNVEIQAILRYEERLDGPVAAIALVPDLPAVLQFDQRLKHRIAVAGRAQILATYVRQIEDRDHASIRRHIGQGPVDNAFQPDDGALALFRHIRSEPVELGQNILECREQRLPLPVCICPEQRCWRSKAIRCA